MRKLIKNLSEKPHFEEIVLQDMSNLAYVFTKEGRLVRWNNVAEQLSGYSKDEMYNKFVSEFINVSDRERVLKEFMEVLAEGDDKGRVIEYDLQSKSGKLIPLLALRSYVVVDGNEYVVGIAINLSKYKKVEGNLNAQLAEMRRLKTLLEAEELYMKEEGGMRLDFKEIIGKSDVLIESLNRIRRVASLDTTVLLTGESGTGKEMMAKTIHEQSKRHNKPFVKIDFAALPQELITCELFGCEKGAISGVTQARAGKFALAYHGTLFMDSIDKIPLTTQAKLLQVLEDGVYERAGDPQKLRADVRVIASTSVNIETLIENNLFRNDLFYLLNIYPIELAPLRERIVDIPLLVDNFVKLFNKKFKKNVNKISKKVMHELQNYSWPGNIRELENIIERAVIVSPPTRLVVERLKNKKPDNENLVSLAEYERRYIINVLDKTNWRINGDQGAAKILDMHPETLRSRIRKLEIKNSRRNTT